MPPYGVAPMGPPTNGLAVGALVCGLLGFIPFVTSLVATCLGIAGMKRAGRIGGHGRGMAIAGLVLGLVGLIVWTLIAVGYGVASKEYRDLSHQYVNALAAGDVNKAAGLAHSTMARSNLERDSAARQTLGKLTDVTVTGNEVKVRSGAPKTGVVTGRATFEKRTLEFTITFQDEQVTPKVVEYWFK